MATLKSEKICIASVFQFEICEGWFLNIDHNMQPVQYTLTKGKKSINFSSDVVGDLCNRNYGLRLVKGRKQMHLPPVVLQAFIDNDLFLRCFDPGIQSNCLMESCDLSHD